MNRDVLMSFGGARGKSSVPQTRRIRRVQSGKFAIFLIKVRVRPRAKGFLDYSLQLHFGERASERGEKDRLRAFPANELGIPEFTGSLSERRVKERYV